MSAGGRRTWRYLTLDVFTDRPFAGNPLEVVPDARGLTTEQMQAIAAEFNYSESTFVLPPQDPAHTATVRIFNRTSELHFAGHPNVGNCPADDKVTIDMTVTQGAVVATGSAVERCSGGLTAYPVQVATRRGERFHTGAAKAEITATVQDGSRVAETIEWSRAIEIVASP